MAQKTRTATAGPDADIAKMLSEDRPAPDKDKLEQLRRAVRRMRDTERRIEDQTEVLKATKQLKLDMEQQELPTLFMEAGVDHVGLPAEGNLPAYDARLRPYYHASISADWDPEKQQRAFAVLTRLELEDLIKNIIEVTTGRGQNALAKKVIAALRKLKVEFTVRRGVPWNSLTAAVKERYKRGEPMSDADLEALGATVGTVVKLEQRKEN